MASRRISSPAPEPSTTTPRPRRVSGLHCRAPARLTDVGRRLEPRGLLLLARLRACCVRESRRSLTVSPTRGSTLPDSVRRSPRSRRSSPRPPTATARRRGHSRPLAHASRPVRRGGAGGPGLWRRLTGQDRAGFRAGWVRIGQDGAGWGRRGQEGAARAPCTRRVPLRGCREDDGARWPASVMRRGGEGEGCARAHLDEDERVCEQANEQHRDGQHREGRLVLVEPTTPWRRAATQSCASGWSASSARPAVRARDKACDRAARSRAARARADRAART